MKFSYNWLKELVGFKESPQELAGFLTLRAFEVEGIGKTGDDWTLDVKILPNRVADASGHLGLAKETAALKNSKVKSQKSKLTEDKKQKAAEILRIKIENPEDCPRYTARVMTEIKVGESPAWLRERLEVCGLQSVNNIVDAANYVMLETGQPLHVFDFEKLKVENVETPNPKIRPLGEFPGFARRKPSNWLPTQIPNKFKITNSKSKTIIVRRARAGEKITTLDEKTYELNPEILVIADEQEPIAIAGIKGGKLSGVSDETATIILESANFNPVRIRLGSRALNLRTDASYRFEHGLDPNQTEAAVNRLADIIRQVAGGTIPAGIIDAYPKKTKTAAILLRPEYAERLIGQKIPALFYKDAFKRLGWTTKTKGRDFVVMPPTERRDIQIEEDVIEEIGRLFDYKNIAPKMPHIPIASPERRDELFGEERTRDLLVGAGFTENQLYQFTGERELRHFGVSAEGLAEPENPMNPETKYLVPRVLIKYVASAAENLRNFDTVKIFGIQKSFPGLGAKERKDLIAVIAKKGASGPVRSQTPKASDDARAHRTSNGAGEEEFYELKGAMDSVFESLGISDHWYDDQTELGILHPYRKAEIKIGDERIGNIGEIHPKILENIKAKARIVAAEIDMEKLASLATAESEFRPVGKYPAIIRDLAIVVPHQTKTEEVTNVIENIGGAPLVDTDLFDYFQDEALQEREEKSLAFHLVFQSPERTLTYAEIDAIIKKITAALEEKGWEVRK